MKKIIFSIFTLLLLTSISYGYSIKYETWDSTNKKKDIGLTCKNGTSSFVFYYPSSKLYYSSAKNSYTSFEQAANNSCNKNTSAKSEKVKVKKNALFCKKEQDIKTALSTDFSYKMDQLDIKMGKSTNSCGILSSVGKAMVVKRYQGKKSNLIDDYLKVKAKNGSFFVRKSELF